MIIMKKYCISFTILFIPFILISQNCDTIRNKIKSLFPNNLVEAKQEIELLKYCGDTDAMKDAEIWTNRIKEEMTKQQKKLIESINRQKKSSAAFLAAKAKEAFESENIRLAYRLIEEALKNDSDNIEAKDLHEILPLYGAEVFFNIKNINLSPDSNFVLYITHEPNESLTLNVYALSKTKSSFKIQNYVDKSYNFGLDGKQLIYFTKEFDSTQTLNIVDLYGSNRKRFFHRVKNEKSWLDREKMNLIYFSNINNDTGKLNIYNLNKSVLIKAFFGVNIQVGEFKPVSNNLIFYSNIIDEFGTLNVFNLSHPLQFNSFNNVKLKADDSDIRYTYASSSPDNDLFLPSYEYSRDMRFLLAFSHMTNENTVLHLLELGARNPPISYSNVDKKTCSLTNDYLIFYTKLPFSSNTLNVVELKGQYSNCKSFEVWPCNDYKFSTDYSYFLTFWREENMIDNIDNIIVHKLCDTTYRKPISGEFKGSIEFSPDNKYLILSSSKNNGRGSRHVYTLNTTEPICSFSFNVDNLHDRDYYFSSNNKYLVFFTNKSMDAKEMVINDDSDEISPPQINLQVFLNVLELGTNNRSKSFSGIDNNSEVKFYESNDKLVFFNKSQRNNNESIRSRLDFIKKNLDDLDESINSEDFTTNLNILDLDGSFSNKTILNVINNSMIIHDNYLIFSGNRKVSNQMLYLMDLNLNKFIDSLNIKNERDDNANFGLDYCFSPDNRYLMFFTDIIPFRDISTLNVLELDADNKFKTYPNYYNRESNYSFSYDGHKLIFCTLDEENTRSLNILNFKNLDSLIKIPLSNSGTLYSQQEPYRYANDYHFIVFFSKDINETITLNLRNLVDELQSKTYSNIVSYSFSPDSLYLIFNMKTTDKEYSLNVLSLDDLLIKQSFMFNENIINYTYADNYKYLFFKTKVKNKEKLHILELGKPGKIRTIYLDPTIEDNNFLIFNEKYLFAPIKDKTQNYLYIVDLESNSEPEKIPTDEEITTRYNYKHTSDLKFIAIESQDRKDVILINRKSKIIQRKLKHKNSIYNYEFLTNDLFMTQSSNIEGNICKFYKLSLGKEYFTHYIKEKIYGPFNEDEKKKYNIIEE